MSKTTLICRLAVAFIGAIATVAIGQPAFSDPVWNVGGSVSVDGTNAPNNFSQTTTLTLGTTTIDSGALNLTSSIVDEPGGAEWLVLDYSTVSGAPIVGNVNSSWQLQALEPLSNPANSLGYYFDWSSNGTLLTPTQSFGGGTPGTNPITGSGTVFVNNTFCPYTSCSYINTSNNTVNFFASTSDYATAPGNNGSAFETANDFEIGVEMQPVPAPLIGFGLPAFLSVGGVLLLGVLKRKAVIFQE